MMFLSAVDQSNFSFDSDAVGLLRETRCARDGNKSVCHADHYVFVLKVSLIATVSFSEHLPDVDVC